MSRIGKTRERLPNGELRSTFFGGPPQPKRFARLYCGECHKRIRATEDTESVVREACKVNSRKLLCFKCQREQLAPHFSVPRASGTTATNTPRDPVEAAREKHRAELRRKRAERRAYKGWEFEIQEGRQFLTIVRKG
jgi:hypothetical protein